MAGSGGAGEPRPESTVPLALPTGRADQRGEPQAEGRYQVGGAASAYIHIQSLDEFKMCEEDRTWHENRLPQGRNVTLKYPVNPWAIMSSMFSTDLLSSSSNGFPGTGALVANTTTESGNGQASSTIRMPPIWRPSTISTRCRVSLLQNSDMLIQHNG